MKPEQQMWKRREWNEHKPLPDWLQRVKDDLQKRGQKCQPVKR